MTHDEVRAYAARDWEAVAASKTAYWVDRFRREGWEAAWNAADALWCDMHRLRPDYPDQDERALDLAAHRELRSRLDRAADALARR